MLALALALAAERLEVKNWYCGREREVSGRLFNLFWHVASREGKRVSPEERSR